MAICNYMDRLIYSEIVKEYTNLRWKYFKKAEGNILEALQKVGDYITSIRK